MVSVTGGAVMPGKAVLVPLGVTCLLERRSNGVSDSWSSGTVSQFCTGWNSNVKVMGNGWSSDR